VDNMNRKKEIKDKKILKVLLFSTAVLSVSFLYGCDTSPIGKLSHKSKSSDLTFDFWKAEAKKNSDLWKEAFKVCDEQAKVHEVTPNCHVVINAFQYSFFDSDTKPIEYGKSGSYLEFPKS